MTFKFIHMADVHFDTPFESRGAQERRMLRDSIREAFERAVDIAISSRVDGMLIAGDLFDNDMLSFATERFIINQMNRLGESCIQVFYATGNHDPGGPAYKARRIAWPENVHVFTESQPQAVEVKNKDGISIAVVAACGHEGSRESRNLAELFPIKEGRLPWVGLLHTDVTGCVKGDEDRYAPCTLKDLQDKGYSYWALGHIHKGQMLCSDPPIVYPGNIMGRNPRETGLKGVYLVEIEGSSVKQDFIPVAPVVWDILAVNGLRDSNSFEELKCCIKAALHVHEASLQSGGRRLVRIILQGPTPLYEELQRQEDLYELEKELEQELNVDGVEIKAEATEPCAYPEDYIGEAHVLGEALTMLEELKDNPEELLKLMEGQLAINNPKWKDEDRITYLKELLNGLDMEITSRLAGGVRR